MLKIVHVKTMKSVALPIYTADLGHMEVLLKTPEDVQREQVRTNLPDLHPRSVRVLPRSFSVET